MAALPKQERGVGQAALQNECIESLSLLSFAFLFFLRPHWLFVVIVIIPIESGGLAVLN